MEQTISGEARNTEEHAKHHLTLEEQLAQLEAKDKKAKETEARRKAKMAKLRSALLRKKGKPTTRCFRRTAFRRRASCGRQWHFMPNSTAQESPRRSSLTN